MITWKFIVSLDLTICLVDIVTLFTICTFVVLNVYSAVEGEFSLFQGVSNLYV